MTGIARVDASHPYSPENLGYTSVGVTSGVEGDEQETYDLLARQELTASLAAASRFSASHAVWPTIRVGSVVTFDDGDGPVKVLVEKLSVPFEADGQCSVDLVEVVNLAD